MERGVSTPLHPRACFLTYTGRMAPAGFQDLAISVAAELAHGRFLCWRLGAPAFRPCGCGQRRRPPANARRILTRASLFRKPR
jgi:hypothetical protein